MKRLYPCFVALVSVAAAVTAAAAAALAADMPVAPATAYNPPPAYRPALYNWTGLYFGGHLGLGVMQDTVTATTTTALQAAGTQTKLTPYGLLGGAQAGFNLEFAPFVVGAEGTWTDANVTGGRSTPSATAGNSEQSTDFAHWYATATGRVGFAANDLLIFAKGGAAWMNVGYTQANVAGGVVTSQTIYDTRKGYTIGGGLEYGLLDNLSAKLEYDFLDFGTENYSFGGLGLGAPFPVAIKSVAHLISLGVNYRFNLGGGG
jgi:outer membrane immunogenic protein